MLQTEGAGRAETWLELRDRMGRLWGRYDPVAERLEFRRGEVRVLFELERYRCQVEAVRAVGTRQGGTDVLE